MYSLFRKLPPPRNHRLVGEGLSHHSDPEARVALPGPVYDSLVSLDIYLWDEQIHCTLGSTERRGILDDFPVLDDAVPFEIFFRSVVAQTSVDKTTDHFGRVNLSANQIPTAHSDANLIGYRWLSQKTIKGQLFPNSPTKIHPTLLPITTPLQTFQLSKTTSTLPEPDIRHNKQSNWSRGLFISPDTPSNHAPGQDGRLS